MGRRVGWRAVLVATVVGVLMGAAAGVAYAVPEERWRTGEFYQPGMPVYAEAVDGWGCHLFLACRDDRRHKGDPLTVWSSQIRWERVMVECYLGAYVKVHQTDREGWTLSSNVLTYAWVEPCTAFDF